MAYLSPLVHLLSTLSTFLIDTSSTFNDISSSPHKKRTSTLSGGSLFHSMPAFHGNRQDHLFQQHWHFFEGVFDVQAFGALVGVFAEGADV